TGTITVNSVKLRACDNTPQFAIAPPAAVVPIDNVPPSVALLAPGSGSEVFVGGRTAVITWSASDAAGVPAIDLAYSTDGGATFPNPIAAGIANTGSYSWTVPAIYSATTRVRATAHDAYGNTASSMSAASFVIRESNVAPTITGAPATATIPELAPYTFTAAASDPDLPAQAVKVFLVGAPAGAAIDSTSGVFTWTPSEAQGPGSYPFQVRSTDGIDTSAV